MTKFWKHIAILSFLVIFTMISYTQDNDKLTCTCAKPAEDMVFFVNSWVGSPYKYGGKEKEGIDCSAFTQIFYKEVFLKDIPRTAKMQFQRLTQVTKECLQAGDLIFFKSSGSPSGWHVGVYLWDSYFVHAANSKMGVIISNISEYSHKVLGYRR